MGEIVSLGSGKTRDYMGSKVELGDRVFWRLNAPCHRCYFCTVKKDFTSCVNRVVRSCNEFPYLNGGFAEYSYVTDKSYFVKVPDRLTDKESIAFGCAAPTIIKAIDMAGGIEPNDTVLVQGCGPVGLFSVLYANVGGASNIIVIGAPKARLLMAKRLGADAAIDITEVNDATSRFKMVQELTNGYGADLCVEAAGNPAAVSEGIALTKTTGRYVLVGNYSDSGNASINPAQIVKRNLRLVGSAYSDPSHLLRYFELIERIKDRFPIEEMVSNEFRLEEVDNAIQAVGQLTTMKAVFNLSYC